MALRPREVQPSGAIILHPIPEAAESAIRRAILLAPCRLSRPLPDPHITGAGKRFPPVRTALTALPKRHFPDSEKTAPGF